MNDRTPHGAILLVIGSMLVAVLCVHGCTLFLRPLEPVADGSIADADAVLPDGDVTDSSDDPDVDIDVRDGEVVDSDPIDGDVVDAEQERDAQDADSGDGSDADLIESPCEVAVLTDTIALFDFDNVLTSAVGDYEWESGVELGCRSFDRGQDGCDQALFFGDCDESWLMLPDDALWDSVLGIDFWFQLSGPFPAGHRGILSRDAFGTLDSGHVNLAVDGSRLIRFRVQTLSDEITICSNAPIDIDGWYHVEMRFGAPCVELWIDGEQQLGEAHGCHTDCRDYTISSNDEPWVLGASSDSSGRISPTPIRHPLQSAAIDHLRFRSSRP